MIDDSEKVKIEYPTVYERFATEAVKVSFSGGTQSPKKESRSAT